MSVQLLAVLFIQDVFIIVIVIVLSLSSFITSQAKNTYMDTIYTYKLYTLQLNICSYVMTKQHVILYFLM